jgi:hypothetical protein
MIYLTLVYINRQDTMKFIREFGLTVIWVALLSYLGIMMTGHFRHIAIPDDPLDEEAGILREIKKIIPAGSQASFATNLSDGEASLRAYYQTQFGCCPVILSDDVSHNDNIIFYRSSAVRDSNMSFLDHCDTFYQRSTGSYTLMLLHKTKNK